jgi:hypothetical protein
MAKTERNYIMTTYEVFTSIHSTKMITAIYEVAGSKNKTILDIREVDIEPGVTVKKIEDSILEDNGMLRHDIEIFQIYDTRVED